MKPLLTAIEAASIAACVSLWEDEDAQDLLAMQEECAAAADFEVEPLLPAELAELAFEEQLWELGVALMWSAWGVR